MRIVPRFVSVELSMPGLEKAGMPLRCRGDDASFAGMLNAAAGISFPPATCAFDIHTDTVGADLDAAHCSIPTERRSIRRPIGATGPPARDGARGPLAQRGVVLGVRYSRVVGRRYVECNEQLAVWGLSNSKRVVTVGTLPITPANVRVADLTGQSLPVIVLG